MSGRQDNRRGTPGARRGHLIDSRKAPFHAMFHATTVLAVRHRDDAVMASDGQVTFGDTVFKQSAKKIRKLYNDRILAGFAGSAADSFALFSRFEAKLEQHRGNLERSAVELAKDWRTDRLLRRLLHLPARPSRWHLRLTGLWDLADARRIALVAVAEVLQLGTLRRRFPPTRWASGRVSHGWKGAWLPASA